MTRQPVTHTSESDVENSKQESSVMGAKKTTTITPEEIRLERNRKEREKVLKSLLFGQNNNNNNILYKSYFSHPLHKLSLLYDICNYVFRHIMKIMKS